MGSNPVSARETAPVPLVVVALIALITACQGAPGSLTITAPQDGSSTVGETVTVRGTAPANSEVIHYVIFAPVARTVADASGNWSFEIELNEGPNLLLFRLGDDESTAKRLRITKTPKPTFTFATPSAYLHFTAHQSGAMRDLSEHVRRIGELGSANDAPGLQGEAAAAFVTAESALAWLSQNPANPCYRELHEAWRQAVSRYSEAFDTIQSALTAPVNNTDLERGAELLAEANELASIATSMDAPGC